MKFATRAELLETIKSKMQDLQERRTKLEREQAHLNFITEYAFGLTEVGTSDRRVLEVLFETLEATARRQPTAEEKESGMECLREIAESHSDTFEYDEKNDTIALRDRKRHLV